MRKVLELPAFRRLLATTVLNELAVSMGAVALALLVYRRTGSAIGAAGFFLCAEFGPAFISPLLVARLDQRSARRVLALLSVLEGGVFVVLAWFATRFALGAVLALALTDGVFALTSRVLTRAAWNSVASEARLLRDGSAIINAALSVCYMAGPAIGGVVVSVSGTKTALLVIVGIYLWISLTLVSARDLPAAAPDRVPAAGRLRSALRIVRSAPLIRRLLGLEAAGMLFFTLSIPVEVVFAQHTLHAGASGYGILLSAWGGGAILGSVIYARWRASSSRVLITLGTCFLAVGFLVMAVAPSLAIATFGAAVGGVGNGIQIVAMRTALQEALPERWMALILSFNESMFQAVPGVGILLGGAVTAIAGPRIALAAGAAGSLAVAGAMWTRLPVGVPELAQMPSPDEMPDRDRSLTSAGRGP